MKWILLVYLFIIGPTGGWVEIQQIPYDSKFDCVQAEQNFNSHPNKPDTLISKCKEIDQEV